MSVSDIILLSSVSVQLLAILALAVSVWSMGQRIGARIDGLARDVNGLTKDVNGLTRDVNGLAQDVGANTTATERLASRLDEHTRHHL